MTLFTVEGRGMGKARISIDGEPVRTIDGYASTFPARTSGTGSPVWVAGRHRLTIAPLGKKRPAATDVA